MPLSLLGDPADLARAQSALDSAWDEIKPTLPKAASDQRERTKLAYFIAALVYVTEDEDDLTHRAIERYRRRSAAV